MQNRIKNGFLSAALLLAALSLNTQANASDLPLGTAFTYQGRLSDAGSPASGLYDFRFSLFDAPVGSAPPVVTSPNPNPLTLQVWVTNGLVMTNLDFGPASFTGAARWLGIEVKPHADAAATYQALDPRQEIKPTPYALFASNAAVATRANFATTAQSANSVVWGPGIVGLPAGFADGVDNDTTYTAGAGLRLSADNQFSADFAGNGAASTISRSDHHHLGQSWLGDVSTGLQVSTLSTLPNAYGLFGIVSSASPGSYSAAVRGMNNGTSSYGIGVWGSQAGYGWGVLGESRNGIGVLGRHTATTDTEPGVRGETASTAETAAGIVGVVSSPAGGLSSAAVRAVNYASAGGYGVHGQHANNGYGVFGEGPNGIGVYGRASGSSGLNMGVSGKTVSPQGYGIYAEGSDSSSAAMGIGLGGIRVVGAGIGSSTPAFTHRATAANSTGAETAINNPLCNGRLNAILLVTYNFNPAGLVGTRNDRPTGLYYSGSSWRIYNLDGTAMPAGAAYNVLVVNP